jgi:hypothetical protein
VRTVEITQKIIFNGREYAGIEEMPADVRRLYEEAMRQAGMLPAGAVGARMAVSTDVRTRIRYGGREYRSPEQLPAEIRPLYEQAMAESPRFEARLVGPEAGSMAGRVIMKLGAAVVVALLLWWILGLAR